MEGNFGGGKIWRIHCKNIFGKIKFGDFLYSSIRYLSAAGLVHTMYACKRGVATWEWSK